MFRKMDKWIMNYWIFVICLKIQLHAIINFEKQYEKNKHLISENCLHWIIKLYNLNHKKKNIYN